MHIPYCFGFVVADNDLRYIMGMGNNRQTTIFLFCADVGLVSSASCKTQSIVFCFPPLCFGTAVAEHLASFYLCACAFVGVALSLSRV